MPKITIHTTNRSAVRGFLKIGHIRFPCALGKSGRRPDKKEGDGASPMGCWKLGMLYFRPDRVSRPCSGLSSGPIFPDDLWCDDPQSPLYNKKTKSPLKARAETLWRQDHIYDLLITTSHNMTPTIKYNGSAIFIHLTRDPSYPPTEGCIALKKSDFLKLLRLIRRDTFIQI